jgi:hypothetical protein
LYEKKFQYGRAYATEQAFSTSFKMFLKVVNLPMCAMRIVPCPRGEFCIPAKILRDGGEEEDCMNFSHQIDEEWACRLYHVAVPEYSGNLAIVPLEDPVTNTPFAVSHSLIIEKKCVYSKFFSNNFHMDNNCIIMTGSGCPDTNSRAFAKYIELYYNRQLQGVCDNNPGGVLLLKSYQHVCDGNPIHNMLKTDVGWFGWSPYFGDALPLVVQQTPGYSVTDRRLIRHLLNEENQFVGPIPKYASPARTTFRRNQLLIMSQRQEKCNLDVLPTQVLLDAVKFLLSLPYPSMF